MKRILYNGASVTHFLRASKTFLMRHAFEVAIFAIALGFGSFLTQGLPLWDDDFTSWLWKTRNRSPWADVLDWINPISTQSQYWGFNERPMEALFYHLGYLISEYESWGYFLIKNLFFAGLGVMIYLWSQRTLGRSEYRRGVPLLVSIFFLTAPGTVASHILLADFAPIAEFLFLGITYYLWSLLERSPRVSIQTIFTWVGIVVVTFLSYRSKADLKLIPVILGAYLLICKKNHRLFWIPCLLMTALTIPWGPEVFSKLPPFLPGSPGSEVDWMWQPASFTNGLEFLWRSDEYHFWNHLEEPTLSLAGVLGPFLWVALLVSLWNKFEWRWKGSDHEVRRARIFIAIWLVVILLSVTSLSPINYFFRIRYGILVLVPFCVSLAWILENRIQALDHGILRAVLVTLLVLQVGTNLLRSINHRRGLGQVMVAVDRVYQHVDRHFPEYELALFPDFRPYDFRPGSAPALLRRDWLKKIEDLPLRHSRGRTLAISWSPPPSRDFEIVGFFSGCNLESLFDVWIPCNTSFGTYLMRYLDSAR